MKNKNILKIIAIILLFIGMFFVNVSECSGKELTFVNNEVNLPKTTQFTLSMWIKPKNNIYYNKILEISDDKESIHLLNNSEDDNYKLKGITLICNAGDISNSNEFKLNTGEWSNLTICINGTSIKAYLDGYKFIDNKTYTCFNNGTIKMKIFDEFEFADIKYYYGILNDDKVFKNFENSTDNKFKSLEFDKIYPSVSAKYYLNKTSFPVSFTSNSKGITFDDNSFTLSSNNTGEEIIHGVETKITINGKDYIKHLSLKQKGNDENTIFSDSVQRVKNTFNYYLSVSDKLEFDDNLVIDCNVVNGKAKFDDKTHQFIKLDGAKEREPITIECTVTKGDKTETFTKDLLLLDKYDGYFMVFFNGEDGWPEHLTGTETLYFAYSKDLVNWDILTKKPIVTTNEGSNRFRDPYINRDKNGNFIITSTEGYYNPGIYVTKSNDLSDFVTTNPIFNTYDQLLGLKGKRTWAPEFIYNQEKDVYTILYSEGEESNSGIYAVDTKDFINFSYPYVYLQTGCNSIDPDISLIKGNYYLFYKDERDNNKSINYALSNSLDSPVWLIHDNCLNGEYEAEGPFVIRNYDNNEYKLFLDGYKLSKVYSGLLNIEDNNINTKLSIDSNLTNDAFRFRHFSIIPITEKEHANIVNITK